MRPVPNCISCLGLFHEKIDKPEVLQHILSDMFVSPSQITSSNNASTIAPQLIAVSFFFAQLASTTHRPCRDILFACNVLPKILSFLRPLTNNPLTTAAAGYLWTCLVNLSYVSDEYVEKLLEHSSMLFGEIYMESSSAYQSSLKNLPYCGFIEEAAQVAHNMSLSVSEGVLGKEELYYLVMAAKLTLRSTSAAPTMMNAKIAMLRGLANFVAKCASARPLVMTLTNETTFQESFARIQVIGLM